MEDALLSQPDPGTGGGTTPGTGTQGTTTDSYVPRSSVRPDSITPKTGEPQTTSGSVTEEPSKSNGTEEIRIDHDEVALTSSEKESKKEEMKTSD